MNLEISTDKNKILKFFGVIAGILIFLALFSGISKAETGTVSYTTEQNFVYNLPTNTGDFVSVTPQWNKLYVDFNNFSTIQTVTFSSDAYNTFQATTPSDYTTWTCTSGCTGSGGYVSYVLSSNGLHVSYVFNTDTSLSGANTVVMNFNRNIFVNVTQNFYDIKTCVAGCTDYINITQPVGIFADVAHNGFIMLGNNTDHVPFLYDVTMLNNINYSYNITYPSIGDTQYFNAYITKKLLPFSIPIKVNISALDGVSYYEQTVSDSTNYNSFNQYCNGIVLSSSANNSADFDTTINSTLISCANSGTVTQPISVNPLTGVGIQFDANSYNIGSTANISWLRNNSTPFGFQDDIYLIQPGGIKKILVPSPGDSGYVKTNDFPVAGEYSVTFERSILGLFIEVLASDTATASSEQASYILVNETVPVGVYISGTYLAGWNGVGRIVIYQDMPDGTVKEIDSLAINGTCCTEFTVPQLFFPEAGNYRVVLMKGYDTVRATASVVAYFTDIIPGANITVSNISLNKNQYTYGEPYTIKYQVDDVNYSNKAKRIIAYEISTGANTLINQVPTQTGTITRTFDSEMYPFSGALQLRLMGLNATGDFLLAYVNFTLSKIDTEGYGLDVTKSPVCAGETGYFTYYSPSPVSITIQDNGATVYSKNLTSSISGKTVPFNINRVGNYEIFLRPSNETDVKFTKIIEVKTCEEAIPPQQPMDGTEIINTLIFLATNPMIWTVIITLGLMVIVGNLTKPNSALPVIVTAWASLGIASIFGAFPLWIPIGMLLIAIGLIASGIIKIFNTGGGGN